MFADVLTHMSSDGISQLVSPFLGLVPLFEDLLHFFISASALEFSNLLQHRVEGSSTSATMIVAVANSKSVSNGIKLFFRCHFLS